MGIKHFFHWFNNQFSGDIKKMPRNVSFVDIEVEVDNLMVDMNGVFHTSAQRIYQYGNFKLPPRLMGKPPKRQGGLAMQIRVFEDVCKTVETLFRLVGPKKRLILCVDGPAPLSKQNQQRQRRFKSAMEKSPDEMKVFDQNSITPGTKFMDHLSKYIDWYIRKRISEDSEWQSVQIVFSSEKVPGEGEQKLINYIRSCGDHGDTYCVHGMDADLLMLSLGTHVPGFYVLRDDNFNPSNEYYCINIGSIRPKLAHIMRWESQDKTFNPETAVDDFIFMCFMVGNDFLPHVPSLEIIENGIEVMLDVYKTVGVHYGHLTKKVNGRIQFVPLTLKHFLRVVSQYEKPILESKLLKKDSFFPDPLLEDCAVNTKGKWNVDIEKYRNEYVKRFLPQNVSIESICHDYLEGLQWVLSYYTRGVPNWKWQYRYHYAPPASAIYSHVVTFKFPKYPTTQPSTPYQQLLSVLPPKSASLIPPPLNNLLLSEYSPLKPYCPDEFEVDVSGKRKEWEGVVLLPFVDHEVIRNAYFELLSEVNQKDIRRNIKGKTFLYSYTPSSSGLFKSFYGDLLECKVRTQVINI